MKDRSGCFRFYHAIVPERIRVPHEEIRENQGEHFPTRALQRLLKIETAVSMPDQRSLEAEGRSTSIWYVTCFTHCLKAEWTEGG